MMKENFFNKLRFILKHFFVIRTNKTDKSLDPIYLNIIKNGKIIKITKYNIYCIVGDYVYSIWNENYKYAWLSYLEIYKINLENDNWDLELEYKNAMPSRYISGLVDYWVTKYYERELKKYS